MVDFGYLGFENRLNSLFRVNSSLYSAFRNKCALLRLCVIPADMLHRCLLLGGDERRPPLRCDAMTLPNYTKK